MTTKHMARRVRRAAGGAFLVSAVALGTAGTAAAATVSVSASPDSNLPDTANVNVSGSGFFANADVDIYQCADVGGIERCTLEPVGSTTTNASGAFGPTPATVHAVFETDFGATECRTGCRILVRHPTLPAGGRDGISFDRFSSK